MRRVDPIATIEDLEDATGRKLGRILRNGDVETIDDPESDTPSQVITRLRRGRRIVAAVRVWARNEDGHWLWRRSKPQRDRG